MTAGETTCPACATRIDDAGAEPLARIDCPKCGEKVRVRRSFDHFEVIETLGVGGMGTVYKARDSQLDRFVALKLLRKELNTEEHAEHLQHEARVTASVSHPNIVQVFSFGRDHDQFYLVMELVDRGSLDDLIEQQKRVPERQVLATGLQVARGLRAAHEKGLIHRDVKPANILFKDAELVKIGDFGLAGVAEQKAGTGAEIWGTPYYVAPERLQNAPEDFRSDIYSLGATMFHAIAGRPPFEGETNSAAALLDLKMHPLDLAKAAPEVSRATARVVNRMIAPDPRRRFVSYDHLITELEKTADLLDGKSPKRSIKLWGTIAAVIIALAVATFLLLRSHLPQAVASSRKPDPALLQRYDDARKQLVAGKVDSARAAFATIANDARGMQPLYDWIKFHQGLAAYLKNEKTQARQAFNDVENAGAQAFASADNPTSFLEAARKLSAQQVVPAGIESKNGAIENFALVLFALKDVSQKDLDDAATLLERFVRTKNAGVSAWIEDYKPLAQSNLNDLRLLLEWRKRSEQVQSSADLKRAADDLSAIAQKTKANRLIEGEVKAEQKRISEKLNATEKDATVAREKQRGDLIAHERPALDAAITNYRSAIDRYDFVSALKAVQGLKVSDESLARERDSFVKKAEWLVEWQRNLVSDINRTPFAGPIGDPQLAYIGIKHATDSELSLSLQYGEAPGRKWAQFPAAAFLGVAEFYVKRDPSRGADRNWLSAVFASETNQPEAAARLSAAAVATKDSYRPFLPLLRLQK